MLQEANFQFDLERLEAAVTPRTRALFLNTPVNPTGYVVTRADLEFLIELAHTHGIWLVSDESYDRMVYDGAEHLSPLGLAGGRGCTIFIRSLTKSYCMPAWRVGYIAAPAHTIPEMTKVLEWQSLFGNAVSQAAAAAALGGPQNWLDGIAEEFQVNRDCILNSIQDTRLTYVVPKGAPFVFLNTSQLDLTGDAFAQILLEQFGIAATPGSTLQAPYHVRIPIGGPVELIEEAGSRIQHASQL
jgi:aspartate/methionine/tyrosine aminotransferase